MNIFNTFHDVRKFFEVIAAYNIDRFRMQSMVSTAHKVLATQQLINNGTVLEKMQKATDSISEYWFYKVLHSPLFKEHHSAFEYVQRWSEQHGLKFNTEGDSFHTDNFCNHMLIRSPHTGGYEIFDLTTGTSFAVATLPNSKTAPAAFFKFKDGFVPLYNFTRRECGAQSCVPIGHQTAH